MAGGLSAAAVLSPHELQRQQEQGTAVWTTGSGAESEDVESQQKESLPMRSTSSRSKAGTRLSPGYVRSGMWVALCLSLVALGGTVATTTYLMRERAKEHETSMHLAAGLDNNSTNALGMARAAQDRSIKLEQALEMLNARLAQVEVQATGADARFMAQCEALLAAQEEAKDDKEKGAVAASAMRTQYVCQEQAGWQLACASPTVIQALVGRFTSAPDGPCADARPARPLTLCPASVDVTAQVRTAVAAGGPVLQTPMELLANAGRTDPCPRSYKQLVVVYKCPLPTKLDAAARAERCRQVLNAGGGASGAAVPPPGASATSPVKGLH